MTLLDSPIIELDSIDSTNNYAMQLIDANKAQQGMTIVAKTQYAGKGQRGKTWIAEPGDSLLMSVIILPQQQINQQFEFNAAVTAAIANVLQKLLTGSIIRIKWPNDIIINDKKAGGILIENVLRGSRWTHSVIGLGLNVLQDRFPDELPHATSLKMAGKDIDLAALRDELRHAITVAGIYPQPAGDAMAGYNALLYKKGQQQAFTDGTDTWMVTINRAHKDGTLEVALADGTIVFYHHGQAMWDWGK